jgi:hypothetical protein
MNRIANFLMLLTLTLLFGSCLTGKQQSTYINYNKFPFRGIYKTGSIKATIDYIDEITIGEQINTLVTMYLDRKQVESGNSDEICTLDIIINERSFISRADIYNTIYISLVLHSEDGAIYAREVYYITQRGSITLATVQNKLLTKMLDTLFSHIDKYEKEYLEETARSQGEP